MDEFIEPLRNSINEENAKRFKESPSEPTRFRPLLKWAGGKSMLLPHIIPNFLNPKMLGDESTYIEPFVGSGCVAIALNYPRMILNDKNIKLMNFHEQVKEKPEKLYRKIKNYVDKYNQQKTLEKKADFYYDTRKKYNELILVEGNGVIHASLFWFLNKTGFNGMYRETKNGDFNIPFGKRNCPTPNLQDFLSISSVLKKCHLYHKPFSSICAMAKKGDIIYLDPPYIPISQTASFSSYLRYGFDITDHEKLCKIMNELSEREVCVVMSNSDCAMTRKVYSDLKGFHITEVKTRRFISGNIKGRGKITELIISNTVKT